MESFVLQNLLVLADAYLPAAMNLYHLRTASGFEIDAMLELGGKLVGIEVKSARSIGADDASNLRKFMETNPACKAGIVAYRGERALPLHKNIWAIPNGALLT